MGFLIPGLQVRLLLRPPNEEADIALTFTRHLCYTFLSHGNYHSHALYMSFDVLGDSTTTKGKN